MRLVPFQLIPDQGSVGYKLYQEAQKAKAEAAKAAAAAKAKPKVAPPKPTATPAPTAPAKPAAPEKSATPIKETGLPEDEAMAFFLNGAKAKYKEAGDRTKVEGSITLGGKVTTAEQRRQMMGNPFVASVRNDFSMIISSIESYARHVADVEKQQAKIAGGDMSYLENLTMSQSMLSDSLGHVTRQLKQVKLWAEENNVLSETQEFFGEYTEFTSGDKLDLLKLFDRFDVA